MEALTEGKKYFKAFIRVVKSIALKNNCGFDKVEVIKEPLIMVKDKNEVKQILLEKYPQFFQNNKVYEKETKDEAQFFYVVIFQLYNYEIDELNKGSWICSECGTIHENTYINKPKIDNRLLGSDFLFCRSNEPFDYGKSYCYESFLQKKINQTEMPDDIKYIKKRFANFYI